MQIIRDLLLPFEANLRRKGRKDSSINIYRKNLGPFVRWVGDRDLEELTPNDLDKFLDWYELDFHERLGRAPANNTRGNIISAICVFFDWAERYDHISKSPARRLRDEAPPREYKLHEWLSKEEDTKLLEACKTPTEFLMVYLLRFTGLRPSEAVNLTWEDIEENNGNLYIHVKESKTPRGRRRIPVSDELRPYLTGGTGPLFPTRTGKSIHRNEIHRRVKRIGNRAGMHVYPRRLRKTLGTSALNNGADLATVSRILGHTSTVITEKAYSELLPETVEKDFLDAVN